MSQIKLKHLIEEGWMGKLGALGLAGSMALSSPASAGQTTNALKASVKHATKGIRNNNPGNINKTSIKWQGVTGTDGPFLIFATPEDGIRALSKILKVYATKYHLVTPAGIMSRWAPPSENPTKNYIEFVANKLGKKPDDKIDINNKQEFSKLVSAIIEFENGNVPYDNATILRGIEKP